MARQCLSPHPCGSHPSTQRLRSAGLKGAVRTPEPWLDLCRSGEPRSGVSRQLSGGTTPWAGWPFWVFACGVGRRLISVLPDGEGFALPGELLLPVAAKVTKNACPSIRPGAWARRVPSPIVAPRGRHRRAVHGPTMPFAASLRLTPLRNDFAQPEWKGAVRAPEPLVETPVGRVSRFAA